jgi:4-hydroxybenzoyl-CoA reductase subunit beta
MSMQSLPRFRLARPRDLAEAAALLAGDAGARVLAGGTDLIANLRDGLAAPSLLVDLAAIGELDALRVDAQGVRIGARVALARLAADARVGSTCPAIAQAAASVAGPAHRNVATVGGNLCLDTRCIFYNQSEWWRRATDYCLKYRGEICHVAPQGKSCQAAYCGDLAPALLALDAGVEITGKGGVRRIALADLYVEDGAAHLALAPGEIVVAVQVPAAAARLRSGYRKARVRGAIDFPLAGVAAALSMEAGVLKSLRIALTGTNARPFVLQGTDALVGKAPGEAALAAIGKLVQHQVRPLRTTATAANYRRQVASVLAQRLVRELAAAGPGFPPARE